MEPRPAAVTSSRSIIRRYYVVRLVDAVGPSFVLVNNVLFMHARGLTQFEINCWAATYFMVAFLTDVPMGAFADAIGRRIAYIVGCSLGAVAFLIYFFSYHYIFFLIAAVISASADMMRNGAVDAWAVDMLSDANHEGPMDILFSRASQIMQFGGMLSVVAGGFLARLDVAIPWLLGAGGQLVMAATAEFLMRGEHPGTHSFHPREVVRRVFHRMVEGVRDAFASRPVLTLGLANAITMAAWSPFWYEWPQFFNGEFRRGAQIASLIYCATSIATMMGAEVVARFQPRLQWRPFFMFTVIGAQSATLLIAGLNTRNPWVVLTLFLIASACTGISNPVYLSWYNDQVEGEHRATLLSFQSTCARMGAAVGLPIGGRIADGFGFAVTWQTLGIFGAIAAPLYLSIGSGFVRNLLRLRRAVLPAGEAK